MPTPKYRIAAREPLSTTVSRKVKPPKEWEGLGERVPTMYAKVRISGTVEVLVDWAALIRQLGRKALTNKDGRARALHGAIIVKATERKES